MYTAQNGSLNRLIDTLTIFWLGGDAGAFTCDCDVVAAEHVEPTT